MENKFLILIIVTGNYRRDAIIYGLVYGVFN